MHRLRTVVLGCTLLAGLALAVPAHAQPAAVDAPAANSLLGTWDVVITFGDGTRVASALSVLAGRSAQEGSVIHAAEASLLLPTPTTPEQGTWERVGRRKYVATHYGFAVDSTFSAPAGRVGFKHAITLSADGESFTGVATFEVLDPAGAVLFSDTVTTAGARQHPVAP
jgi:hypothetical protein